MGLIKDAAKAFAGNVVGVAGSVVTSAVSDQYLEFFTCDSLGQDILVREGAIKMEKGRNKGSSEVISNGSIVAVPEGTACLLVDGGRIVDAVMEAGYYKWDNSSSPSIQPPAPAPPGAGLLHQKGDQRREDQRCREAQQRVVQLPGHLPGLIRVLGGQVFFTRHRNPSSNVRIS